VKHAWATSRVLQEMDDTGLGVAMRMLSGRSLQDGLSHKRVYARLSTRYGEAHHDPCSGR